MKQAVQRPPDAGLILPQHATNTAAKMTSCRVDLMALQIKFTVITVITFITNNAIQWMQNITHRISNLNVYAVAI